LLTCSAGFLVWNFLQDITIVLLVQHMWLETFYRCIGT
jgi:hypothetical protein